MGAVDVIWLNDVQSRNHDIIAHRLTANACLGLSESPLR